MAVWQWQAAGQPMTTQTAGRPAGSISDKPSLVATVSVDEVLANIETRARTVVDARANDRYRGENETIDPVGGHIPGAKTASSRTT
jgi:thiosulfate/3-mercaptopyruvate sulfurtransferase